jgi:hypothetical protein
MIPSFTETVETLAKLLAAENAALVDMDFARAGALLAPKHAAADALAAAWRAAPSTDMPNAALQQLGQLADENRRLLNRAMRVQRRVLDLVARAARAAQPATRYSADGAAAGAARPRALATRV